MTSLASAAALVCLLAGGEARAEPKDAKGEGEALPPAAEVHLAVAPSASGSWTMTVSNDGKTPVRIVADARLLWLEVVPAPEPPPAKPLRRGLAAVAHVPGKMASCRAPAELRGAGEESERSLVLKPGERYEEAFDPMLLCGAGKLMAGLKTGAVVYPHLGYPDPPHHHARKPKAGPTLPPPPYMVESLKDPRDITPARHLEATPFVVYAPPPEASTGSPGEGKPGESKPGESKPGESKPGEGKPGESKPGESKPGDKAAEVVDERAPRLEITSTRLSDASSGAEAVLSVTVANRGKRAAQVHLRSDDIAFDLRTPGGRVLRCDAGNDRRASARDFFESLGPGSKRHFALRLRELCPVDAFARPGVYEATARVELNDEGERYHLDALVTRAAAAEPSRIRVRTGRLRYHVAPPEALPPSGVPGATPDGE